jgi:hypothetical protein
VVLRLTCKQCQRDITGTTEEELVANVEDHVAGHAGTHRRAHPVSREHVLRRLRRQDTTEA